MAFIPRTKYIEIQSLLPILCVDCVIVKGDKCLLLRRTQNPAKGQYWFPGGRVFKGESIADASLRKAHEEVNLDCQYKGVISVEESMFQREDDMSSDVHTVNICCHLSAPSDRSLTIDEYHDGYIWVNAEEAKNLNLHRAVYDPLSKCLRVSESESAFGNWPKYDGLESDISI